MKNFVQQQKFLLLLLLIILFKDLSSQVQEKDTIDYLTYSLEELMDIAIYSVTKEEQKVSEAPAVISVITSLQIKRRGYVSVAEALESLPGIDVLNDHSQYNVGVRGINSGMRASSRIMKVMIDNQAVSFRTTSENFLGEELIPISAIERIEVIRGPSSALYGANAYLAVINIITKSAKEIDGINISGNIGNIQNNLSYAGSAIIGKNWENINFITSFSNSYADRSGISPSNLPDKNVYNENNVSSNDISKPIAIFSRLNIGNIENAGLFSADFNYQKLDTYGEFQDWAPISHKNHIILDNMYIRGEYKKNFNENFNIQTQISYSKGNPNDDEKLAIGEIGYGDWGTRDLGYKAIDFNAEMGYFFNKNNNIKIEIDLSNEKQTLQTYYYNYFDKPKQASDGKIMGNMNFKNTGIYLQNVSHPLNFIVNEIFEKTSLTIGLRYDINNIYKNVLNYRMGLVIPFSEDIYTKILYGTSFKAPASTQLYTNLLKPRDIIGNPNLEPEEANTLEMVFGYKLTENFNILLNGYMTNIKNKVEFVKNKMNIYAENVNEINSYGLEGELLFVHKNISSYLNYSYQYSSIVQDDTKNEDILTKLYPSTMVKFGTNYFIKKIYINLNLEAQYIDERIASEQNIFANDAFYKKEYSLDPYISMNFTLSTQNLNFFSLKETILKFKIYNLLNKKYNYPGFKNFDIPALDRYFIFSITQNF